MFRAKKSKTCLTLRQMLTTILLSSVFTINCSDNNPLSKNDANPADNGFEYVSPEDVGWSSAKLAEVERAANRSGYAAMMALHDGKVFFSWGDVTRNYQCHSIRKPFLSALFGIHVAQGEIDLDDTLAELNIDDISPSLTLQEKQATVRNLLQSRSGVYHEAAAEAAIMIATRPERGSHEPGTFYYYNNWDFNALGTIFEQETGTRIFDEFKQRIADPIRMQDFNTESCWYELEPEKSMHPAYKFRMSARDMARFGVLYQQNGFWNGEQIIPASWIVESTQPRSIVDNVSGMAYGYMWKVFPENSLVAQAVGYAGYYHTGISVHALVIIPELKLVIVQRYDTDSPSWTGTDDDEGFELGLMLINARQSN